MLFRSHARVLPVDDPDPTAVIDEVGIEQVVVTRSQLERVVEESPLDLTSDSGSVVVGRGDRHASCDRERPVRLADPKRHEQPGNGRSVVDAPQGVRNPFERLWLPHCLDGDGGTDDEPSDEVALRPDECGDLGTDTDAGCRNRRGVLDLAADPERSEERRVGKECRL